jgi:hypothetical protein
MHGLDLFWRRSALSEKRLQCGRDRDQQRKDIAQRDLVGGLYAVGAILAPPSVAYADLVLVVEPGLIELGASGVENPAAKAASYGG